LRLGGYVIHGDSADTLARCLDALVAVADTVVAVDSGSSDGSAALAEARGVRRVAHAWEGYGAARAVATRALDGCDYVFFLDSDEWLLPEAVEAIRAWKRSGPEAPHYSVVRRDWAELPARRFLFRTERHVRLARAGASAWDPRQIVHETLPRAETVRLPVFVEHRFATSAAALRAKVDRYALLWAIRSHAERRRQKTPLVQALFHFAREAVVKGALLRGGADAFAIASALSSYHRRKYELLREVSRGAYPELVRAFDEGRLGEVYRLLPAAEESRA
jgi:(heptosyl)LPS beta-1,4-glucosyltransferase